VINDDNLSDSGVELQVCKWLKLRSKGRGTVPITVALGIGSLIVYFGLHGDASSGQVFLFLIILAIICLVSHGFLQWLASRNWRGSCFCSI